MRPKIDAALAYFFHEMQSVDGAIWFREFPNYVRELLRPIVETAQVVLTAAPITGPAVSIAAPCTVPVISTAAPRTHTTPAVSTAAPITATRRRTVPVRKAVLRPLQILAAERRVFNPICSLLKYVHGHIIYITCQNSMLFRRNAWLCKTVYHVNRLCKIVVKCK